jgi:hypothetical protein
MVVQINQTCEIRIFLLIYSGQKSVLEYDILI